jgi:hypothetical protein
MLALTGLIYSIVSSGVVPADPLFETTIYLNLVSINLMMLWTAMAQYTPTMQPFWPVPEVSKRPDGEHTTSNKNIAMM